MITGKDSWKKGAAIFGLVLLAAGALIGGVNNRIISIINSLIVAGLLGWAAYKLYQRWKDKETI